MILSKERIEELMLLAGKATPGPWVKDLALLPPKHMKGTRAIYYNPNPNHTIEIIESPSVVKECILKEEDAIHIAAFNPETATQLCKLALAAGEMAKALESIDAWFEFIKTDQEEKLHKGLDKAIENWDLLECPSLDLQPMKEALLRYREAAIEKLEAAGEV